MTDILAVALRKGGVGKTAIAATLAGLLAESGERVLLIDSDSQGHAALMFAMAPRDDLYAWLAGGADPFPLMRNVPREKWAVEAIGEGSLVLLASSTRTALIPIEQSDDELLMRKRVQELAGAFDTIVIDTAPSTSALDALVYLTPESFLCVVEPEALAVAGLRDTVNQITAFAGLRERLGLPAQRIRGVIPNKLRTRTNLHWDYLSHMTHDLALPLWPHINLRKHWAEATTYGRLVYTYAPKSDAAEDARELLGWILETRHA